MKTNKFLAIAFFAATMLAGCNKADNSTPEPSNTAVQFTTSITKASGTSWAANDKVGVFMKTAGADISTSAALNAANVLYTTDGSTFTTATPIYYPQTGTVDFVAYYPYRTTPGTDPYVYKVNVATQTDPTKIDLLWSNDAQGVSKSKTTVPLQFSHMLSKVVLTVEKGAGMTDVDFSTIGIVIKGMPTKADFSLADGTFSTPTDVANIKPCTVEEGTQYEAIVIPQTGAAGRSIVFTVGTDTYTYVIPADAAFAKGQTNAYTVTISKTAIKVTSSTINNWDSGSNDIGEAYSYQVGDYFPNPNVDLTDADEKANIVGVVFRAKTATQTGLVVALNESDLAWGPKSTTTSATNEDNGAVNMATIKAISGWATNYPAFAYCDNYGTLTAFAGQWYLPAKNELRNLYASYSGKDYSTIASSWATDNAMPGYDDQTSKEARATFNAKLTAGGGTAMTSNWYWSSSEDDEMLVWVVRLDEGNSYGGVKDTNGIVRAVLAF